MFHRALLLLSSCCLCAGVFGAETPPAKDVHWVALWQDAFKGMTDPGFDPERFSAMVAVDRTTGDAFLATWNWGVWRSSDGGNSFTRVDGGKIAAPNCGPVTSHSVQQSPEGRKIAVFNMNNGPGPSGYTLDGKTWESFTSVGRNWDFGAMDWDSSVVLGARHEDDGLHVSLDAGKTWTRLARSRGNPFVSGLGVVGRALLLATAGGIERSEDDGKTWTKVSPFDAAGDVQKFQSKLWWLSPGKRSVLSSTDEGKSWAVHGEPAPAPVTVGPLFGKDENHIVLAGNGGFYESTDGAKTWTLVATLPQDFTLGGISGAAFDPVHDVFYVTNFSKAVMRHDRVGKPEYVLPPLGSQSEPHPRIEFVEAAQAKLRCWVPRGMAIHGSYAYVAGEDGLICLKRELQTGKVSFVEQLLEMKSGGFYPVCAGGHLYGITPHNGYKRMKWHGLAWFDFDPQTGRPVKKGVVEDCPGALQILASPDQKDLYLRGGLDKQNQIFWYRLAADGKPEKAGEVAGKGINTSGRNTYPGILAMTADGKFLYSISAKDYAIACVERAANGALTYKGATDLSVVAKNRPDNYHFLWVALGLSSDGKWLYASLRNGKPAENFYGIFKRNPETGELTHQETISGLKDPLANLKGWNMVFAADGKGGYLGSCYGPLTTFNYDSQTGHLTNPLEVEATRLTPAPLLLLDAENGLLYQCGDGLTWNGLVSYKVGKEAAPNK